MIRILIFLIIIIHSPVFSQEYMGYLFEKTEKGKDQPVAGANVVWLGTTIGTQSESDGMFMFQKPEGHDARVVISFVGYKTDTVELSTEMNQKIYLTYSVQLGTVNIKANKNDSYISKMNPLNTNVIGSNELKQNACCNLSESFEKSATVDVSFADAVSGVRQIQMLGLSGIYVQTLTDVLPTVRGLGINYGLSFIPGPWIQSIELNKGTGSVANGYESITGSIDAELKKPESAEKLFVNFYGNSDLRGEVNLLLSEKNQIISAR